MYKHETVLKAAGQGTVSAGTCDKATVKIHVINDRVDQEGGDDHSDKPQKESCGLEPVATAPSLLYDSPDADVFGCTVPGSLDTTAI